MADYQFGQTDQGGSVSFDSALTLRLDYWTLTFNMNLSTSTMTYGNSYTQAALNKVVQIISERGQPVLLNNPTFNSTTGVSTLIFAIEHQLSWNTNEGTAPVYGLGAAGAATDNGVSALEAKLIADGVNIAYQSSYPLWATGTISAGTVIQNSSGNYYMVVLGGTATTGNAPTGTGTNGTVAITTADGLVYWYLGAALPLTITNLVGTPVYSSVLP
jgi:hypothetical protein